MTKLLVLSESEANDQVIVTMPELTYADSRQFAHAILGRHQMQWRVGEGDNVIIGSVIMTISTEKQITTGPINIRSIVAGKVEKLRPDSPTGLISIRVKRKDVIDAINYKPEPTYLDAIIEGIERRVLPWVVAGYSKRMALRCAESERATWVQECQDELRSHFPRRSA